MLPIRVKIFPFLDMLCDAMLSYGLPIGDKITLELSNEPYNRLLIEFNNIDSLAIKEELITLNEVSYRGFKFCIKELS